MGKVRSEKRSKKPAKIASLGSECLLQLEDQERWVLEGVLVLMLWVEGSTEGFDRK